MIAHCLQAPDRQIMMRNFEPWLASNNMSSDLAMRIKKFI